MKFIVDRKTWARGRIDTTDTEDENGHMPSNLLLDNYGMKCCLGFVGEQCGIPEEALLDIPGPGGVDTNYRDLFPSWLLTQKSSIKVDSDACEKAIEVNDDSNKDDAVREAILKELFAKHGDEIEFVG